LGGEAKTECIRELTKFLGATHFQRIHFQILGIVSREASAHDVSSDVFRNIISDIYLQEGPLRACGLSTLITLSQHEQKQKHALEKTIQEFSQDSSLEVRERLVFREKEKPLSNYELDILENYLNINAGQIQGSSDPNLLSLDTIKKWGAEVGNNIIKVKTASPKEAEQEKVDSDEYQTYKEIF
jgi:hypothetical protein